MKYKEILLSSGSLPWMNIIQIVNFANETNYTGIELLPTRIIPFGLKIINQQNSFKSKIKSIHQNWRLDTGHDKSYGIKFPMNIFFVLLRFIFFPKINRSTEDIKLLSDKLCIPVTVHDLSDKWTKDNDDKDFSGGISYEIIGSAVNPEKLKQWMKNSRHNVVIDSRDDQSLLWAEKYGFDSWQKFWRWLGIDKIESYQLTFIGYNGLQKIFRHHKSLPEEQLLWLKKNNWNGKVVVEINPLMILILCKGDLKRGFKTINQFVRQTLIENRRWS
jgi:hypothetical protein